MKLYMLVEQQLDELRGKLHDKVKARKQEVMGDELVRGALRFSVNHPCGCGPCVTCIWLQCGHQDCTLLQDDFARGYAA